MLKYNNKAKIFLKYFTFNKQSIERHYNNVAYLKLQIIWDQNLFVFTKYRILCRTFFSFH